jgi:signal peptidase I
VAKRALDAKPVKSASRSDVASPRRVAEQSDSDDPPSAPPKGGGSLSLVRDVLIILVVAVAISTLIRTFVFEQFRVPTGSMEQTLEVSDRIFVAKLTHYQRGDIIVFEDKLNWLESGTPVSVWWKKPLEFVGLLPDSSKQYLVKRLIGLPGDHVTCCGVTGKISVNGDELDETYLYRNPDGSFVDPSDLSFDVIVPAGHVFVLGDHRDNSADSRYHLCNGPTPTPDLAFPAEADIEGPVVAIAYPLNRITHFSTPAVFDHVPPPTGSPPAEPVVQVYPKC